MVGAISESKRLTQQSCTDMQDHKYAHDERIFVLPALFDFRIQQDIFTVIEPFIFGNEAAAEKNSNADKESPAHQVGDEVEGVDDDGRKERKGDVPASIDQIKALDESFDHIHKIDKSIRDQTEEQPKMNRAQNFARLEDGLLEQNCDPCFDKTRRDVLQLGRGSSLAN